MHGAEVRGGASFAQSFLPFCWRSHGNNCSAGTEGCHDENNQTKVWKAHCQLSSGPSTKKEGVPIDKRPARRGSFFSNYNSSHVPSGVEMTLSSNNTKLALCGRPMLLRQTFRVNSVSQQPALIATWCITGHRLMEHYKSSSLKVTKSKLDMCQA